MYIYLVRFLLLLFNIIGILLVTTLEYSLRRPGSLCTYHATGALQILRIFSTVQEGAGGGELSTIVLFKCVRCRYILRVCCCCSNSRKFLRDHSRVPPASRIAARLPRHRSVPSSEKFLDGAGGAHGGGGRISSLVKKCFKVKVFACLLQ